VDLQESPPIGCVYILGPPHNLVAFQGIFVGPENKRPPEKQKGIVAKGGRQFQIEILT